MKLKKLRLKNKTKKKQLIRQTTINNQQNKPKAEGKQINKQTNKKNKAKKREKNVTFPIIPNYFKCSLPVSILKICLAQIIYVIEIMLFVICHFL